MSLGRLQVMNSTSQEVSSKMHIRRFITLLVIAVILGAMVGCSRDPNVRKQKYLESGKRYFEKGKYREAAIQYSNSLQVDSNFTAAHYELARTYMKMQSWNSAYDELMKTLRLDPNNLDAHLDLGNLLLAAKRLDRARDEASLVLAKDPNNAGAHALIANLKQAGGDSPAAIQEMQTAISLSPKKPEQYLNLGLLQIQARDLAAAEASFKKSVEIDPKYVNGVSALGTLYQMQQRWDDAERQFHQVIAMDPQNTGFRWALARLYLAQGKKDQAEQVLQQTKQQIDTTAGYRVLGDYYLASGQRDRAMAEFASLVSEHPKDAEIRKSYILLLMRSGRLDVAAKLNDEALKKNGNDTDSLAMKGEILVGQGRGAEAVLPLETALKARPENPGLHYQMALAALAAGDSNKYEAQLRDVARLDARNLDAWERLGRIAIVKNDASEVEKDGNALIAAAPQSPAGYVMRAGSWLMRADQARAELDIKKAIEVAPTSSVGYSKLGELRLMQKRIPEAEKLFLQARQLDPKAYEPVGGLVQIYSIQKQAPKAVALTKEFLAQSPNNAGGYLTLATLLGASNDLPGAEQSLRKAIELDKKNLNSYRLLVGLYQAEGEQQKEADTFNQWIQVAPRDPLPLIEFGAFEQDRGNMKQAERLFAKALQLQPENPAAANNMAYLLLQQNRDIDQAISLAQIARRAAPRSPAIADTLAWAYVQKGLPGSAIDLLQEAIKASPNNPAFHYHLGVAYQRAGDKQRARTELEQVMKLNPNYQPADVKKALDDIGRS